MYKATVNRERRRVVQKATEVQQVRDIAAVETNTTDDGAEWIVTRLLLLLLQL